MKNTIFFIIICLLVLVGCEKDPDFVYPQDFNALNIWLGTNTQKPDSLEYNFAFKPLKEIDSIMFSVRLTGVPSEFDRPFNIEAVGGDISRVVEGEHYELKDYVLEAGLYEDVFPIYIYRSSDFKDDPAKIIFALEEGETFKKGITERSDLTIVLKDEFSKPLNWDADTYPYYRLSYFFGVYSDVKFRFITTAIGQPPVFKVIYTGTPIPQDEISFTQAQYYQRRCKTELLKYNAEHEEPLRNEDNELVVFP